jgi:hypothetical protein
MNLNRRRARCAGTNSEEWTESLRFARQRRQAGFMLSECLIYLAVSSVLLGLAFAAFYRVMDNAKGLRRNAAEITRVLQAGERWREDIHHATGPLQLDTRENAVEEMLHIPQQSAQVVYWYTGKNVLRRAGPGAPWIETLGGVKRSHIVRDARSPIFAWRWEVELNSGKKLPLIRPLFTFLAVAREEP